MAARRRKRPETSLVDMRLPLSVRDIVPVLHMHAGMRRAGDYAIVMLGVAIGAAVAVVAHNVGLHHPAPVFLLVIAASIWYLGLGPGLLAMVLSILSIDFFVTEPLYTLGFQAEDLYFIVTFGSFSAVIAWFTASRRGLEAQLQHAHEELKARHADVLAITHDAIFLRDLDGLVQYWNPAAEQLFGFPADVAMGRKAQELLRTVYPVSRAAAQEVLLSAGRWEGQLGQHRQDGQRVIVFSRWSLQRDAAGRPAAILESNNDVTEQVRAMERVQALNAVLERRGAELQASNRELEAFAYSVSHDLRAPLRHVSAYSELLQKSAAPALEEKGQRYLANIVDASRKMGNLIDDLLAFSRIGRAESRPMAVSLDEVIQEVVRDAARDAEGRAIEWRIGALPEVRGDRSMLRLALFNLVANAVKFTRTRSPARIEIGASESVPGEVVVFVRDNGVGFDMTYADKLFGVFQRLHTTQEFEGTGIGLATVQRVAVRHGGRAWAEGAVEHGATFHLSLPQDAGEEA